MFDDDQACVHRGPCCDAALAVTAAALRARAQVERVDPSCLQRYFGCSNASRRDRGRQSSECGYLLFYAARESHAQNGCHPDGASS